MWKLFIPCACALLALASPQSTAHSDRAAMLSCLEGLTWRCIGPARGGRAQCVAGVVGDPHTFYMGSTGGGVWKTDDAGASWRNVTDGFVGTGSVGDIAVAESDPNVVYVGMGEADIRGNFSHGDGVYRSVDAGKTWTHVGLEDTRQIGRIAIDPRDPDVLFVAALGHVFGTNAQRGLFRSRDGGETWERVLFVDDRTGAIDVAIDPHNPRVVFAAFWQVARMPWRLDSGGPGSGLYRSTDGGTTRTRLETGLPKGTLGKIGVSPSAAQRDLVYAIVEAEDGGVFRSTDGGDSWRRVNDDRALRQRAWYYTHVIADPIDAETVYVMNVGFHKSIDGGRSFSTIRVPHVDNHDLWIDPVDNRRMANANDGGANVSFDGGASWSTQTNQPTAQFYRVTVDNRHPYRVYGAQQDNSTASVSSRGRAIGPWERDLYSVGGCECGYIAVHPEDPDIVYAGCYGGSMTIYDHATGETRDISIWPENPMGSGADVLQHRFQWTFPIVISPHDPETVYAGAERVFRTHDRGASWQAISPDLTTNDKSKQRSSGGPITQDNTSVEYYCTIFTIAESPIEEGLLWVGTDDGLVHVSSDGGESWTDVTPDAMGDWPLVSLIEASPHDPDTAWAAVTRYKMNDFRPMIYRTTDRGATWTLVVDGIAADDFVRAVREDPEVPGLLYAATETGVYVSLDAGARWSSMRLGLPAVPVTDVAIRDDDLVISTQGRSFWIFDDLAVVRQIATADLDPSAAHLFRPAPAHRERWDEVRLHLYLPTAGVDEHALTITDADGDEIRVFDLAVAEEEEAESREDGVVVMQPGRHLLRWNFRHERPTRVPGAVAWPPHPAGPRVPPGTYQATLARGEEVVASVPIEVLPDPRHGSTPADYQAQYDLLLEIHDALDGAHEAVNAIRSMRREIDALMDRAERAGLASELEVAAKELRDDLDAIEEVIIQTRSSSPQDPLNYPIKLNDKIGALAYTVDGDHAPTEQSRRVFAQLRERLDAELERLAEIRRERVAEFNELVADVGVPAIVLESAKETDDDAR